MMLVMLWLKGLVGRRRSRLIATSVGVATAVALLASIGAFLAVTTSKMSERSRATVAVDWQVEAQPGASSSQVLRAVNQFPGVKAALPVSFTDVSAFQSVGAGASQQTGKGKLLGLPRGYANAFPDEIRLLSGSLIGPLLAQQTASNLHAKPGDVIAVARQGMSPAKVKVAGVVDLPAADSLFQQVGAPPGAQAQAPPDNVLLLPQKTFDALPAGPVKAQTQIHVAIGGKLPSSPSAAFTKVSGAARNLETRLAGTALVGDNLSVALDQARSDALYAELLFLFLGIPGAILVALVTAAIATASADRRRRDAALLRTRGASSNQLLRLALGEAVLVGAVGSALGLVAARLIGSAAFGTHSFGPGKATIFWGGGAVAFGLGIALLSIVFPAWKDARSLTVSGQRRLLGGRVQTPMWSRYGLDFVALAIAGLIYWQASRNGYKLVLAPEGVPQISVNWYALLAPVMTWIGLGLLTVRVTRLMLGRGSRQIARLSRPVAGELAPVVSATMGRQRTLIARGVALVALTAAFAGSTSIFNATYQQQAAVDARLSNGADVAVTESPGVSVGPSGANRLAGIAGVSSVEPLQHRYAYVGADLQDLYGVRPNSILTAGKLQNSWFQGGSAKQLMRRLSATPDGVLVSDETVKDFQLSPGDLVRLRLQNGVTKKLTTVPFHYVGVALEFPTAPRDSFLVANANYVAKVTGSDAVGTFLLQTNGANPAAVAARVRSSEGTSAHVTDIVGERKIVGSSLTAVELTGLTKVELAFALLLAIASSGLVLGLGFQERRRSFAITRALGAKQRQLGAFVWTESLFVTAVGIAAGAGIAAVLSKMLVKVLTGVFDPPPDVISIPWLFLAIVGGLACAATILASLLTLRALRRPAIEELREP